MWAKGHRSRAKECFLEQSSFPELLPNSLVWDGQLAEDFGFIKLPANNNLFIKAVVFFFLNYTIGM